MKIAINCWVLRNKNLDGIGHFTVQVLTRMISLHPETQFQILCDRNFRENYFDFPNVSKHYIFPPRRHPVLYVLWMELVLPFFFLTHKPDLFLSMEGFLSLNTSIKQLPVIYDINFEHKPEDIKWFNRKYFTFFFQRFARKATRIATISEYSKRDISTFYHINPDKIDNVSCGINPFFAPLSEEEIHRVREKWAGGKPYFFFVGSMHPRKNIPRLIQAFERFKGYTLSDYKLVLAGSILWNADEIKKVMDTCAYRSDIIFTGRLSDGDLKLLLGAAFCLSFVPIFEGFGLPIVEAMQARVPVICSNVTSMPEVAGNAAHIVDPFEVDRIAAGMAYLYQNPEYCRRLVLLGEQQKLRFSWDRTAAFLWESILKALA